jgi:hypothetical protein
VDELAVTPPVWSDELVRYRRKNLDQVIEAVGGLELEKTWKKERRKRGEVMSVRRQVRVEVQAE